MKNSIEVEIPKEITDYQPKVMWGFTSRQLISVLWVGLIVIPLYMVAVLVFAIESHLLNVLVMILAIPPLAWGFVRKNGVSFELLVKIKYQALKNRYNRVFATEPIVKSSKKSQAKKYNEGAAYEFEINVEKSKSQASATSGCASV